MLIWKLVYNSNRSESQKEISAEDTFYSPIIQFFERFFKCDKQANRHTNLKHCIDMGLEEENECNRKEKKRSEQSTDNQQI